MDFFIKKTATDPILKLELIDDGINDKNLYHPKLENSLITIDVFDPKTEEYIVIGGECSLTLRTKKYNFTTDEYYIVYRFTEEQTSQKGKYEAIITIQFLDINNLKTEKLIVPIKEKLYINIV